MRTSHRTNLRQMASHWRESNRFWPTVVAISYLSLVMIVAAAEYFSEMVKLSRGAHTDTFWPFLYLSLIHI